MKLSIIIPAHNEAATIGQVLEKVAAVDIGAWKKEVIAVNDGSGDNTGGLIEKWASSRNGEGRLEVQIIHHKKNLGKGAAIRSALAVNSLIFFWRSYFCL